MEGQMKVMERNLQELRRKHEEEGEQRLLIEGQVKNTEIAAQEILRKLDEFPKDPFRIQQTASVKLGAENMMGRGLTEGSHERWRKINIPLFGGEDAYGWVNKVERLFPSKGSTRKGENVTTVTIEGQALS